MNVNRRPGCGGSSPGARVLLVTSNFPRWEGDSTTPFVLSLAQDLQAVGWSICVLAPHAEGCARQEVLGGVQVKRFRYLWPASSETVCYGGGALINLRKNRLNLLKLPAFLVAEWYAVRRELATESYDILHSHWVLPQGLIGTIANRRPVIPHVITIHGSDVLGLRASVFRPFKRHALLRAHAVTVNSSATEEAALSLAPSLRSVYRIPMGVSEPVVSGAPTPEDLRAQFRRGDGPLLIAVGRVVREKGIEDLLRALSLVSDRLKNVSVLIVGEGQDRAALEGLARDLGLRDRVHFSGWVAPEKVANHLAAADIFVSPSWSEAQGLSIIEAMVAGKPVVVSRVGGTTDVVTHEQTGLLVEKKSPREIAGAVERLALDQEFARELAIRARAFAKERYSRTATAEAFSRLFAGLCAQVDGGS